MPEPVNYHHARNCWFEKISALLNLKLNNGARYTRFLDLPHPILWKIQYISPQQKSGGQQIYYCNVSNLATCQLFLPFIIFFLNAEEDNFIFTKSKILQGVASLSQQKAAASH